MNLQPNDFWIPKFDNIFYSSMEHRYKNYILKGGRGSTKSSFIGFDIVLLLINNPKVHAAIFRKVGNTLKTSVYGQISWSIGELGLNQYFTFHTNPLEIIYNPTGQKILFFGLDDAGKIKSIKIPFGYIGITWFEELDQFSGEQEIRKVLQSTQRGGDKFWNFMSFNPPLSANNWANEYVEECEQERQDDTLVVHSTYKDVPPNWLGQAFIEEALFVKRTNERVYKNEYLGIPVGTGGNIFPNVEALTITDDMIGNFDYIYNGLDWGFANDPAAFVKVAYVKNHHNLYIFGEVYDTGLTNYSLFEKLYVYPTYMKKVFDGDEMRFIKSPLMDVNEILTADSAEPKSIADFRAYGCTIRGAEKFGDSIRYGIKWLQSLNHIYIDKQRCPNAYAEFMRYEYDRDRYGNIISAFPDYDNHTIDAVRYATMQHWRKKGA